MKAFIVDRYGKQERGRIGEMPDPELRENDVLVQVYTAGVNLLDSKIRSGEFKLILLLRASLSYQAAREAGVVPIIRLRVRNGRSRSRLLPTGRVTHRTLRGA